MPFQLLLKLCRIILINYKSNSFKLFSTNNWCFINRPKYILKLAVSRTFAFECITHQSCWKCGQSIEPEMEQYFCVCGVVQPPISNRSYFQIMGLRENFDLDLKVLNERFRQLQVILHPDKYAQKSEKEKEFSSKHSVVVNSAYQTLRNPLKRGFYLLGIEKISESKDHELHLQDDTFLGEIFSINEHLMNAFNRQNKEELADIEVKNNNAINELINHISLAFKSKNDDVAKELLFKLKYRENLSDKIQNLYN